MHHIPRFNSLLNYHAFNVVLDALVKAFPVNFNHSYVAITSKVISDIDFFFTCLFVFSVWQKVVGFK